MGIGAATSLSVGGGAHWWNGPSRCGGRTTASATGWRSPGSADGGRPGCGRPDVAGDRATVLGLAAVTVPAVVTRRPRGGPCGWRGSAGWSHPPTCSPPTPRRRRGSASPGRRAGRRRAWAAGPTSVRADRAHARPLRGHGRRGVRRRAGHRAGGGAARRACPWRCAAGRWGGRLGPLPRGAATALLVWVAAVGGVGAGALHRRCRRMPGPGDPARRAVARRPHGTAPHHPLTTVAPPPRSSSSTWRSWPWRRGGRRQPRTSMSRPVDGRDLLVVPAASVLLAARSS